MIFILYYILTSSPIPRHGPWGLMLSKDSLPYKVSIVQVWTLSDRWLSKYGLLENSSAKTYLLDMLLDFDLQPQAPPPPPPPHGL